MSTSESAIEEASFEWLDWIDYTLLERIPTIHIAPLPKLQSCEIRIKNAEQFVMGLV